jgi:peptide/nickel transport system permease protein
MLRLIIRQVLLLFIVCLAIVFLAYSGMNNFVTSHDSVGAFSLLKQAWQDTQTYFSYLAQGDLGSYNDLSRTTPVADVIWSAYLNSMGLMATAMATAGVLGLLSGLSLALTHRRSVRFSLFGLTIVGISAPSFLAVVILQQIGLQFNTVLGQRLVSMGGFDWSFEKMFLPVLILTARPLAYVTRIVSASLGEIIASDYIRTAHAKGLSPLRIASVHVFPNLAIPYLSALGVSFRFSLSTLILVEFLFAWPGVGRNLFTAIGEGQVNLVVGLVLLLGLTIQITNFLLNTAYRLIDPRTIKQS